MTTKVPASDWLPDGPDTEAVPAGRWWDVVTIPAAVGEEVIDLLGSHTGAIFCDRWETSLRWLVKPGAADEWVADLGADVTVAGSDTFVIIPGLHRVDGPHWRVRPTAVEHHLTDAGMLHEAIKAAIRPAQQEAGSR